jgi:mannose/fructose/N-acetylgalactosamine-specific phosphotransferase system component IIB
MRLQSAFAYLFLAFSLVSFYGCTTVPGFIADQTWSKNYALMEGVQANDPAIVDGDLKTIGQSQYAEASSDMVQSHHASSESVIFLPDPQSIHRIVMHSSNVEAFDIWVADNQGRWGRIKEIKSVEQEVIDVRLNRAVRTSGVKIRIRRTSDDAELRQKNIQRVRGWRVYSGHVKAPAKISEIELYGFTSKQDTEDVQNAISEEEADAKELDELLEF